MARPIEMANAPKTRAELTPRSKSREPDKRPDVSDAKTTWGDGRNISEIAPNCVTANQAASTMKNGSDLSNRERLIPVAWEAADVI